MAENTFIITERPDLGGILPPSGEPARFEWDADHRSAPLQPWSFPLTQRTVRTDYPGSDRPTEQVLGSNYEPFSIKGRWVDKFNPLEARQVNDSLETFAANASGFAIRTWEAFDAMVRRGNAVEIAFGPVGFEGIITNFTPSYKHDGEIGYAFTFSPHQRSGAEPLSTPPLFQRGKDPATLAEELNQQLTDDFADVHASAPDAILAGPTVSDVTTDLEVMAQGATDLAAAIEQRVLVVDADPVLSIARAINAADTIIQAGQSIIVNTATYSPSATLIYQTGVGTLEFETWSRGLRSQSRLAIFNTWDARTQLDAQADPNALALYRPFKNESVYSISRRFYGTPFQWRIILERNRLKSTNMLGTELLIIPEAPVQ